MIDKNKGGRPADTPEEKASKRKEVLSRIEPYLKSGLSVRKALAEAQISNAMFYRFMDEDEGFREQINQFRQFVSVLANNAIVRELMTIIDKQNGDKARNIKPQSLSPDDRAFLQWFALKSNLTKEEWGDRESISLFDPEAEIQEVKRIIEGSTTKKINHA